MGIGFLCSWFSRESGSTVGIFWRLMVCLVLQYVLQGLPRLRQGLHPQKMHTRNGALKPGQETIRWQWDVNLISTHSCEKGEKRQERCSAGAWWRWWELSQMLWGSFSLLHSGSSAASEFLTLESVHKASWSAPFVFCYLEQLCCSCNHSVRRSLLKCNTQEVAWHSRETWKVKKVSDFNSQVHVSFLGVNIFIPETIEHRICF